VVLPSEVVAEAEGEVGAAEAGVEVQQLSKAAEALAEYRNSFRQRWE
jgi:hypothetical protein